MVGARPIELQVNALQLMGLPERRSGMVYDDVAGDLGWVGYRIQQSDLAAAWDGLKVPELFPWSECAHCGRDDAARDRFHDNVRVLADAIRRLQAVVGGGKGKAVKLYFRLRSAMEGVGPECGLAPLAATRVDAVFQYMVQQGLILKSELFEYSKASKTADNGGDDVRARRRANGKVLFANEPNWHGSWSELLRSIGKRMPDLSLDQTCLHVGGAVVARVCESCNLYIHCVCK